MFERLIKIIGKDKLDKINNSQILLIGVGGVGGYIFNSLVRNGFKNITIIDFDKYELSNLNRQLYSSIDNIGLYKVNVLKDIALSIRKDINITAINVKLESKMFDELNLSSYTYIIDACDDSKLKIDLLRYAKDNNINIISSMGTGNRLYPSKLEIMKLKDTFNDPLAKKIRTTIGKKYLNIPVLCSTEVPIKTNGVGTCSDVPMCAASLISSYVLRKIIED